jgi:A nuclease family of the HNH/ENDO VII superfamily with conserved AHH
MGAIDVTLRVPFWSVNLPGKVLYREGWVRHHLIPLQCIRDTVLGPFLLRMRDSGFHMDDFRTNGILLPTLSSDSKKSSLPVHVGGHPNYNWRIMTELHAIRAICESVRSDSRAGEFALSGLRGLQKLLRKTITNQGVGHIDRVSLNGRTDGDLDALIDRLLVLDSH